MITRPILAAYCGHYGIDTITVSDVQRLDILFYAFGIVQNGTVTLEHPEDFAMFQKYRQLNPQLKILLSLSGGGENGFSTAARTPAERERLVVDTLRHGKKTSTGWMWTGSFPPSMGWRKSGIGIRNCFASFTKNWIN